MEMQTQAGVSGARDSADELVAIADQEFRAVESALPTDPLACFAIFLEVTRAVDYWAVVQEVLPDDRRLKAYDFDLVQWGWNPACALLFSPLRRAGGIPMQESTPQARAFAMTLLHQLGRSILLRRAADMVRFGILACEKSQSEYRICQVEPSSTNQFLDTIEFVRLEKLEMWKDKTPGTVRKWVRDDIETLMRPLIHPWDSGRGIMMGYGALPEVDNHFLAEALKMVLDWRDEAGIHPDTPLGRSTGGEITAIAGMIIGLHLKHVRFASIAARHHPEISTYQSLTIWKAREELNQSISDYTGLSGAHVARVVDALAFAPGDIERVRTHTTPFRPLLVDLGNGFDLLPVSSLLKNPFHTIRTIHEWRDTQARNRLSFPREEWLRTDLYALFQGNRYYLVDGSVKVRTVGRIRTDIDAGVFDRTSGELALFQIKWQDWATNDVRQLRSKSKNFVQEMDTWANCVDEWCRTLTPADLARALRLPLKNGETIKEVFLFGLSRTAARVQGYGYQIQNERLALSNWPQFIRARYELGPADNVLARLHERLSCEMSAKVHAKSIPVSLDVAGRRITFDDLWNAIDE